MYVAPKRALAMRPSMPATPCSAKTSIVSSILSQYLTGRGCVSEMLLGHEKIAE